MNIYYHKDHTNYNNLLLISRLKNKTIHYSFHYKELVNISVNAEKSLNTAKLRKQKI